MRLLQAWTIGIFGIQRWRLCSQPWTVGSGFGIEMVRQNVKWLTFQVRLGGSLGQIRLGQIRYSMHVRLGLVRSGTLWIMLSVSLFAKEISLSSFLCNQGSAQHPLLRRRFQESYDFRGIGRSRLGPLPHHVAGLERTL